MNKIDDCFFFGANLHNLKWISMKSYTLENHTETQFKKNFQLTEFHFVIALGHTQNASWSNEKKQQRNKLL